jgi:hypothetical protein
MRQSCFLMLLAGFAAVLSLASCSTTTNAMRFEPMSIEIPVSASGSYLDVAGNVITPDKYEVIRHLKFEKLVMGPINRQTHSTIDLSNDFRDAAAQYNASAIVNVTISALEFYQANEKVVGWMKMFGPILLITGGGGLIAGIVTGDSAPLTVGAVVAGLGGVTLIATIPLSKLPTRWTIRVEGDAVKLLR